MIQQVEAAAAWKLWLLEVSFVALLAEMKAQEKETRTFTALAEQSSAETPALLGDVNASCFR